jgi:hypothetical protein
MALIAHDAGFQTAVRTTRGIKWGYGQHKLADYLSGTFGREHEERVQRVYRHGLLKQALNEILGENGWRCEMRDGSQWILATDRARPGAADLPADAGSHVGGASRQVGDRRDPARSDLARDGGQTHEADYIRGDGRYRAAGARAGGGGRP